MVEIKIVWVQLALVHDDYQLTMLHGFNQVWDLSNCYGNIQWI